MSRTYTNVPHHNFVYVVLHLFRLDSWDGADFVKILIDNNTYQLNNIGSSSSSQLICGAPGYKDMAFLQFIFALPHTSSNLTFTYINGCNQASNDESPAIRKVSIIFKNAQATDYARLNLLGPTGSIHRSYILNCTEGFYQKNSSTNSCTACDPSCKLCSNGTSFDCTLCNLGYFYENGQCKPCNSSCRTCMTSDFNKCTSCNGINFLHNDGICRINCTYQQAYGPPYICNCSANDFIYPNGLCWPGCEDGSDYDLNGFHYCNKSCPPGEFLFQNGTCMSGCGYSFTLAIIAGNYTCSFLCPPSYFYFQNGTCSLFCPFPYVDRNLSSIEAYCDLPCPSNKFFYLNNSCLDTCDSPFSLINYRYYNICQFPCVGSDFLYSNGSCFAQCPLDFSAYSISIYNYCEFNCPVGQYLFPDSACSPICQSPHFKIELSSIQNYCFPPCPAGKFYYLNQSCLSTCISPYLVLNYTYYSLCAIACVNSSHYLYENSTCKSYCDPPFIKSNTSLGYLCHFPCLDSELYSFDATCQTDCLTPSIIERRSSIESYCNVPCRMNEFYFQNGTCLTTCPSYFVITNHTYYLSCDFPCANGTFLYQNLTCLSTCNSPFLIAYTNVGLYCNFACSSGLYYYQNSTCHSSCGSPFVTLSQGVENYCNFPCTNGKYLYQNLTCLDTCDSPFIQVAPAIGHYCNFPCSSGFYYPQNSSCRPSCNSPFIRNLQGIESYCSFPCSITSYLFSNGSCFSNCSFPFYQREYIIGSTCNFPCSQNEFFHLKSLKCVSSCIFPDFYKVDAISAYCDTPVASEQIKSVTKAAETAVQATAGTTSSLMALGVDPSTAAALISVLQSFFYLLFFNVVYPKNVESILGSFNIVNLSFLPNPLYFLYDEIPEVKSPPRFYDNGYTGLFIESAGRQVMMIAGYFSLSLVSLVFGYFIRGRSIFTRLFGLLYRKLRLSMGVRIIVVVYMDILMCSMLSMLSENSGKKMIVFSRTVSYIFFSLCLIFPFIMLHFLRKPNNSLAKLKKIEPMIEDYDIHDKDRKIFGFYILVKREIHSIVIVGLYYVPLFQTLIPVLLNLVIIVLYIKLKPHHRMAMNIYETLYEVGYFVLHLCVLCLAYMDTKGMKNLDTREFIGWLMIGTIMLNIILSLVQIWAENIKVIKGLIIKLKKLRSQKKRPPKERKLIYKREIKRRNFPNRKISINFDDL